MGDRTTEDCARAIKGLNSAYLLTYSQDDNNILVWKLDESRAVCGSPGGNDQTLCVKWLNNRNDRFVTGGYFSLRVWQVSA